MNYPKEYFAIKVFQPFGVFFIFKMTAKELLEVSFSDALRYDEDKNLKGSQRFLDEKKRVKEITEYINGQDTAFPNSIIISANYNQEGYIEENEEIRWQLNKIEDDLFKIKIPTNNKLAAIIDGQHRVNGFRLASENRLNETELLVAVYFDLQTAYQAYLFATINYNQKPVNKSLALEQFGYLTELTPSHSWSPELLSVYLTKKLNIESDSPFFNHIKVAPQNDQFLLTINQKELDWIISTATVVDGFLRLITTNPKRDADSLRKLEEKSRKRIFLIEDSSPLRDFYLENNDLIIYKIVYNFFVALKNEIFDKIDKPNSFIRKTIGIQALFSVLKEILTRRFNIDKNISVAYFSEIVNKFNDIDFSDNFFTASGIGKSRIQNIILIRLGFKNLDDIRKNEEKPDYIRLANIKS
ncbi:MAG: DGQHR domain-containing protein [Flavobacterium sp.]|uniref:DGQHR domain-containing protein n=1 Tax=Flavobacterium sp. TaxID=239 RepID=UPI003BC14E44